MFYQWFSFKKQSHLLSNLDSFFLTMVLSRHVLSYRIPWCYRTMSQSYLSPWCYRTMASSYLILFLTHPTFVIVPWNIYHTKIYCKWTSLFDRAYRANLRPEKVIYDIYHSTSRLVRHVSNQTADQSDLNPNRRRTIWNDVSFQILLHLTHKTWSSSCLS